MASKTPVSIFMSAIVWLGACQSEADEPLGGGAEEADSGSETDSESDTGTEAESDTGQEEQDCVATPVSPPPSAISMTIDGQDVWELPFSPLDCVVESVNHAEGMLGLNLACAGSDPDETFNYEITAPSPAPPAGVAPGHACTLVDDGEWDGWAFELQDATGDLLAGAWAVDDTKWGEFELFATAMCPEAGYWEGKVEVWSEGTLVTDLESGEEHTFEADGHEWFMNISSAVDTGEHGLAFMGSMVRQ